jgi:phosphatidylcholine synthase
MWRGRRLPARRVGVRSGRLALAATARHERRVGAAPEALGSRAAQRRVGADEDMATGSRHLFAIHLLTASGAALALLAVMAIADGDWNTAFVWLGIALLIDGIDGPLARRHRVRERLPKWDGAALDFVIDYTTYVFAPAIILARALELPPLIGPAAGIIVAVVGALYFADTRMKQPDNSFRGFPAVWNMVVFGLYAFLPPWPVTVVVVIALSVMTFLPINFVHPVRVVKWRALTLAVLAVWFVTCAWLIWTDFQTLVWVKILLAAASAYLLSVAAIQQYLRH